MDTYNIYNIKVMETYCYNIDVKADSEKEALQKAKTSYENADLEGVFVADATTIENTKFKIVKNK